MFPRKWKIKKANVKHIIKSIKKNYRKSRKSIIEILLKMRKLKKGIMATLEKKCQTPMEKQKKIYKKLFL